MIKFTLKGMMKVAELGMRFSTKFIPNPVLQMILFEIGKKLVKRTNTPYDNKLLKVVIQQSNFSKVEKDKMLAKL